MNRILGAVWLGFGVAILPWASFADLYDGRYDGRVFITGIVDADPSDEPIFPFRNFSYKAIEFFSEVEISGTELRKFALRVYEDSKTAGFNPNSDAGLNAMGSIPDAGALGANSKFYAVKDAPQFNELYSPVWAGRNGAPARILYEGSQMLNFDGNEVYQLIYYPNGVGSPSTLVILDTFGQTNYPGFPAGVPSFSYDNSWAYRKDNTRGSGTAFNPTDWVLGGVNAIQDMTKAATAAAVPFGTYGGAVPEASTLALGLTGLALLHLRRRRA